MLKLWGNLAAKGVVGQTDGPLCAGGVPYRTEGLCWLLPKTGANIPLTEVSSTCCTPSGGDGVKCVVFCFSNRKFLLSGVFLQAKFRLALDMSDTYSESMSEPVHRNVYKLNLAVGAPLIAGKKTIPERAFPISSRRIKKAEQIC